MDSKEIKELIELISESSVSKFEMEKDGLKLKVVKDRPQAVGAPVVMAQPVPVVEVLPAAAQQAAAAPAAPVDDGGVDLKSPIVGTFYRSPSPEAPNFVEVGSKVAKGQVLCIIEAMKVMNEIESEMDAEVLEVLVADGQPVEYGENLFRMKPL